MNVRLMKIHRFGFPPTALITPLKGIQRLWVCMHMIVFILYPHFKPKLHIKMEIIIFILSIGFSGVATSRLLLCRQLGRA